MPEQCKVLLVHPNVEVIASLKSTLAAFDELEVVGDAGLGPVALTWARTLNPDLVVVVMDEPITRPLTTIQTLAQGGPPWTIVAVTHQADREIFRKAVLAGATDVLLRTAPPAELRDALVHARRADYTRRNTPAADAAAPAGTIITVAGVKGGIGKTTVATNLAVSLAHETSGSVAIVDLDLPFGDVALMLDVHPERDVMNALEEAILNDPDRLQAQLLRGPEGVYVLAAPSPERADGSEGEQIDGRQVAELLKRLASLHDFVVVDTPPGITEVTAAALDTAALALLVTTPEAPCVRRTQACLQVLKKHDFPMDKVQVLLNRAESRTGVNEAEAEALLGRPVVWRVYNDFAAMKAAAYGQPVVLAQPGAALSTSIRAIARQLGGLPPEPQRRNGWLRSWLPQVAVPLLLSANG